MTTSNDRLLSVSEVAEVLKLSVGTIYHLVSQKRIPVVRLSARCIRFDRRTISAWLDGLSEPAADELSHGDRRKLRKKSAQSNG